MKLLLATHNAHKRREFGRLLPEHELRMLPAEVVLPPEDGLTFAENALGKARAAASATGEVTIADDSGIASAALGGAPGVRSARYAGEQASDEDNLLKLLREAPAGSALAYVCALAYVDPIQDVQRVFEGRCTGRLAARPRGERGFGYDPAFLPDEQHGVVHGEQQGERRGGVHGEQQAERHDELTMAELSDERKDQISHRGRAARALQQWLRSG